MGSHLYIFGLTVLENKDPTGREPRQFTQNVF